MAFFLSIKKAIKSVKDFCVKYWHALIAGILVLVGFVLGRGSNKPPASLVVENEDNKIKLKTADKISKSEKKIEKNHQLAVDNLSLEKEQKLSAIKDETKKNIENLSNNSDKLDKILQDEFNLKKGK